VFNKLTEVYCTYLSNTTLFDGRYMYSIYYIRQTTSFGTDNGHLQVVNEIIIMHLYGAIMGCVQWYSTVPVTYLLTHSMVQSPS